MHLNYPQLAIYLWIVLAAVWLIGLAGIKPTVRIQSLSSRLLHIALGCLGFGLLYKDYFHRGWLALRFVPRSDAVSLAGLLLMFAGVLFASWARLVLGGNWSSTVTLKQDHTLIRRGPYSIVRHPIYTGFLTAVLGDALILGEVRGLVALAVLFLTWTIKSTLEERMMYERFGAEYIEYRNRVKGLVPFVY
jgi:protein-S-isoprenylcysteine O-methyltransferase Ste14